MCVSLFSYNFCAEKNFLIHRELIEILSQSYLGVHVKYGYLTRLQSILNFLDRFPKKNQKPRNIKFHEIPTSESRAVQCGGGDGRTDMNKLIVAIGNFANGPKTRP